MNIGVLGGTFDPIHLGHLLVAEEARARLDLAEVLFVPAGEPWLKANNAISPAQHRLEMVRLAIAGEAYFKLSAMEIERAGPTYTVDTIAELQARLGAGDELFFILGWDNLNQLPQWREPSRLIKLCRLVAVPRVDFALPELSSLEAAIPGLSQRVIRLDEPRVDVNASEIRRRVARGLSISRLVPEAVERYIIENKLYARE
ncbi:MAG TPA: nicotinate-nucleotide adenylyltransferase [Dehalococcoidia bacterium]|nr:nicotinate-nucleotide adenylyltransferase [Dehalococcoidia bacterium]